MSYKAAQFPGPKHESKFECNAQVQAVVRLHTLQSLQNLKKITQRDSQGKLAVVEQALQPPQSKESWEYLVLQKTLRKGRWNDWVVWGFADETTLAKIDQQAGKKAR